METTTYRFDIRVCVKAGEEFDFPHGHAEFESEDDQGNKIYRVAPQFPGNHWHWEPAENSDQVLWIEPIIQTDPFPTHNRISPHPPRPARKGRRKKTEMKRNFFEMPAELAASGWGQESLLREYECRDSFCNHCGSAVRYHKTCLGQGGKDGCDSCHPENFIPGWEDLGDENCKFC